MEGIAFCFGPMRGTIQWLCGGWRVVREGLCCAPITQGVVGVMGAGRGTPKGVGGGIFLDEVGGLFLFFGGRPECGGRAKKSFFAFLSPSGFGLSQNDHDNTPAKQCFNNMRWRGVLGKGIEPSGAGKKRAKTQKPFLTAIQCTIQV